MSRFRNEDDDPWGQDRRVTPEEVDYLRDLTPGMDESHPPVQPKVEMEDAA